MIQWYPHIDVLKGTNLLSSAEDTKDVAEILYKHYESKLAGKNNIVLLMGHGNPDENYNANKSTLTWKSIAGTCCQQQYLCRYCGLW